MNNKNLTSNEEKIDILKEEQPVKVKVERKRRIPYKKFVNYGPKSPPMFNAVATNISETGLQLQTNVLANNTFDPGTFLNLSINVGLRNFKCEGVVTWTKTFTTPEIATKQYCMGIKFTKISKALLKNFRDLIYSGYSCLDADV